MWTQSPAQQRLQRAPFRHCPLELRVEPEDRRCHPGNHIWITASPPDEAFRYLMIVSLASTGEVQVIFPSGDHVALDFDALPPRPSGGWAHAADAARRR